MNIVSERSDLLSTHDHRRDAAGLTYVYPVWSRRAGGLSVGVNLNPNHACNWRCIYCQVPDLKRGGAPTIDLTRLERELRGFLDEVLHGDFFERRDIPAAQRRIRDVALSGDGESTSCVDFDRVIARIGRVLTDLDLAGAVKLVLITNGSLIQRGSVQRGLREMATLEGEVWFKLDSATQAGIDRINDAAFSPERARENLLLAARLCPTWAQTCVFSLDGQPPSLAERRAYVDFLRGALAEGAPLRGVLLYGLARPSRQPEALRLAPLPRAWLEAFGAEIGEALNLPVRITE